MGIRRILCSVHPSVFLLAVFSITGCSPASTPTLFIPPPATIQPAPAATVLPTASPVLIPTTVDLAPTPSCTYSMTFLQDVTFPDGTTVTPGQLIDKQWLITNSGTCNWDLAYRVKLVSGDPMGAGREQALYPARAGTNATLRMLLMAPSAPGPYKSAWQVYDSNGQAMGVPIYIQIVVSP